MLNTTARKTMPTRPYRLPAFPGPLLLGVICWILAAALSSPAQAEAVACLDTGIEVLAASEHDRQQACKAVSESEAFLAASGLKLPAGMTIQVVGHLEGAISEPFALADYDGRQRSIHILDFARAQAAFSAVNSPGLRLGMSPGVWRSYITHELTHAAIHAACGRSCPDLAAHEYIASVAQLSVLPEAERSALLAGYSQLEGFAGVDEISEIYYAMNPCQFMVKSYLHYRSPGHGNAFIKALLQPSPGKYLPR
jgi:hypothetical protein